jgi:hypothetical protein
MSATIYQSSLDTTVMEVECISLVTDCDTTRLVECRHPVKVTLVGTIYTVPDCDCVEHGPYGELTRHLMEEKAKELLSNYEPTSAELDAYNNSGMERGELAHQQAEIQRSFK